MKAQTESAILTACLELLRLRGVFAWRSNNAGVYDPTRGRFRAFRGLKGVADIIGIVDGKFLAIEVKRPGGKTSADQEWFLDEVRQRGGLAVVVRSVAELDEFLKRLTIRPSCL